MKKLNELADELALAPIQVPLKELSATESKVEKLVRVLEPRCSTAALNARLREAVQPWKIHNGFLSQPMTPAPSQLATPGPHAASSSAGSMSGSAAGLPPASNPDDQSIISQHKVLQPGYIPKSKAFMLTFNDAGFDEDSWLPFKAWVKMKHKEFGSRAWAACLEISVHAQATASGKRYHLHAYFYWTDGVGTYHRNLNRLCFQQVTPRVDKCIAKKKVTPRAAACHGLWYVTLMKSGTLKVATNYEPGKHYRCTGSAQICLVSFFHQLFKLDLQIFMPMLTSGWTCW